MCLTNFPIKDRITDKILPIARMAITSFEAVYAVVFMDAIHYHDTKDV